MIIDKKDLQGTTSSQTKYYSNTAIKVLASSEQCDPHEGRLIHP